MALFGNPRTLPRAKANVVTEVNARLIEAWRHAAGDKYDQVCRWLVGGAPAGTQQEYTTCGIFPEVDKMGDKFDLRYYDEAFVNYTSVDADPAAKPVVQSLIDTGYVDTYSSYADVVRAVGRDPITSKLKMITKVISAKKQHLALFWTA